MRLRDLAGRSRLARRDQRPTLDQLVHDVTAHGAARRSALAARLRTLVDALDLPPVPTGDDKSTVTTALGVLVDGLAGMTHRQAWVMLAVLRARLPLAEDVRTAVRYTQTDGPVAGLRLALAAGPMERLLHHGPFRAVRVVRDAVVVDVHHTAEAGFATGIQRVTRETTRRWAQTHDIELIGWHEDLSALRALTPAEAHRACFGGPPVPAAERKPGPVLVPLDSTVVLPELATETERTDTLRCLAEYSGNRFTMIGYDMVPITVPETTHGAMPGAFARNLAAMRYADAVATISKSAAVEYAGWVRMLNGIGLPGPRVVPCVLPNEVGSVTDEQLEASSDRLLVPGVPMVLVVGTHEPRKNHLAVLHAAELLWREGHRFTLTMIGGRAWNSARFDQALNWLQQLGRPIEIVSKADDALLWSAYRLARFSVFPSVNEGYGLPVVESILSGTPVITSRFGSMAEIVAEGGALLVDPYDDHDVADAMRTLLTNDAEWERLRQEARQVSVTTWDDYAAQTWRELAAPRPAAASTDPTTATTSVAAPGE